MYSIKPGRGPSLFGAILALIAGVPFMIYWIASTIKDGAPGFFVFMGFVGLILVSVVAFIGFYNATSKNRISQFDITTKNEEFDPMDCLVSRSSNPGSSGASMSCHDFVDNQVRLQLFMLAYNLGNFLRQAVLPKAVRHWTLTTLREKLIKIGAKVVRHSRQIIFQMAEVAVPRELFRAILEGIERLRLATAMSG